MHLNTSQSTDLCSLQVTTYKTYVLLQQYFCYAVVVTKWIFMLILCYWFSSLSCILVLKLDDYLPPGAVFCLNCSLKYFLVLFSNLEFGAVILWL